MSLKLKNPHERDTRLFFDEEPHIYYLDGERLRTSVTTMIHSYFSHFDGPSMAKKCHKRDLKKEDGKYNNMTVEEILQSWEDNRIEAASAGTKMHKDIELYYNGENPDNDSEEFKYFLNFHEDFKDLKPFRTEWEVFYEEANLAGSIDMIFENEDGTLHIYDWKRSKEISKFSSYGESKSPIDHLPDTNFWHYSLQLNTYKYILENKYDKIVKDLCLVVLHPVNNNYIRLVCPNLQDEVKMIMESQILIKST